MVPARFRTIKKLRDAK